MHINITAPVNQTSYGLASWQFMRSLDKAGHDITLWGCPNDQNIQGTEENIDLLRKWVARREVFDWWAPSLRIWHQNDMMQSVGKGRRLGMTFFELDKLKPNEVHQLNSLDMVIVPSQWAKQVCKDSRVHTPVEVVPLGYDPEVFYARDIKRADNKTIFLNIGKWEVRKGHDVLVEMFNKAFTKKDNVELWMSNHNQFLNEQDTEAWVRLYKNSPLGDKVKIIPWEPTQQGLAKIMASVDCGIFPSRAEGWGLESLEMMAMDKEVIITNNSAHTEYCKDHNCYLIETPEKEVANDSIWFHGQTKSDGMWAKLGDLEINQAADLMRVIHKDKQEGRLHDQDKDVGHLTWDRAAGKLVGIL